MLHRLSAILKTEMTKVCFLVQDLEINGGIGRVISILSAQLAQEKELELSVLIYADNGSTECYSMSDKVHLSMIYTEPRTMTKAMLTDAVWKVRRYLREEQIDILIACGALYFPLAVLATWGTQTRFWSWEHTDPSTGYDHRFQMQARKFGIRHAQKSIVLTRVAERYYLEILHAKREQVIQIYNPAILRSDKRAYSLNSHRIISVGRLTYQKNFSLLVDIAADVLRKRPGWSWDVYGDGEEREDLQQKAETLGISESITFKGVVPDLIDRYVDYSFIVMTSRYEGFPMSLLEAGAAGLPMISFDIQTGPSEIIEDGINGYLIDPLDRRGMAEAIFRLIDEKETRLSFSEAARQKMEEFSIDGICRQWKQLLSIT